MTGTIKNINEKGYGFILSEGKEYFFHNSQCLTPFDSLNRGERVEFETEASPKGERAVNVRLV